MIEYIKIIKRLRKYLKMEEVINSDSTINAYFLYQTLNNKLSKINDINHLSIAKDFYLEYPKGKIKLNTTFNDDFLSIRFFFDFYNNDDKSREVIIKEVVKNKDGIHNDTKNIDFIKKYYDELMMLFHEKEKLYSEYKINGGLNYQSFKDELFELIYIYNDSGIVDFLFRLKNTKNMRSTLSHDKILYLNLERFIEKHKIELLKRFSIQISDLSLTTKLIIEENLTHSKKLVKTIE